jgi:hypothetical protein
MRPLKLFTVLTISLMSILAPKRFATACGFYVFPGEYRFWLLQPDLANQKDLTPFFFATTYLYHGNLYAGEDDHDARNIDEWYRKLKGRASKKDIDSLLNSTAPGVFFSHEKELAGENSCMAQLHRREHNELYRYLVLSKKIEDIVGKPDPWGENDYPVARMEALIREAEAFNQAARDSFVRLRSAYQLTRLYGYHGQAGKLARVYDTQIAPLKSNSWVKTAALYQKAIHTGGPKGDYLLSKVFDAGGYNRSQCIFRVDFQKFDSIIALARDSHERLVIRGMRLCQYPGRGLDQLRNIYRSEPAYRDFSFLVLREINKVEDWLATTKLTSFERPATSADNFWLYNSEPDEQTGVGLNFRRDKAYAGALLQFLLQVIQDNKRRDIGLLQLAAAHLALINGDAVKSAQLISEIRDEQQLPLNLRAQIRINRFLLQLENGFDAATQKEFMSIISQPPARTGFYDDGIMKDQLILYTARKLISQGQKAKGLLLLGRTRRAIGDLMISTYKNVYQEMEEIATPEVYDEMLAILARKNKDPFERFITNHRLANPYFDWVGDTESNVLLLDRYRILDGKASWFIRNHRLREARAVLRTIPDSFYKRKPYSTYIGGDPFFLNVYRGHQILPQDHQDLGKKQVIEEMISLEERAVSSPKEAGICYYKLANAWYNMTWFGKNWLMVRQWWSINEPNLPDGYKRPSFAKDFYGCQQARAYYLKALRATNDKELAALCCFMAGNCDLNDRRFQWTLARSGYSWSEYPGKMTNPYPGILKAKGGDEGLFNRLVKECPLYLDYIGRYNKKL